MCDDPNILNCLSRLGWVYELARAVGAIGIFIVPIFVWLAFSRKNNSPRFMGRPAYLVVSFRVASGIAAAAWALAAFFVFPGVLFCSVFCFLGIGVPAVGVATALALIPFVALVMLAPDRLSNDPRA